MPTGDQVVRKQESFMERQPYSKPVVESLDVNETRLDIDIEIGIGLPGLS